MAGEPSAAHLCPPSAVEPPRADPGGCMASTETFVLDGHIVDSLLLAKVLDLVLEAGADYELVEVDIGRTATDTSHAVIEVSAADDGALANLAELLRVQGANPKDPGDAEIVVAASDGVLPTGFHSTTNLATEVRVDGHWVPVVNPEMDCGLRIDTAGDGATTAHTVPMHRVNAGDRIVVGGGGVRVHAPLASRSG